MFGVRQYASGARFAARAGEEVVAVDNAHRAPSGVMEVTDASVSLPAGYADVVLHVFGLEDK